MAHVVKQFLVEVEVDVGAWCEDNGVDEGTALEQIAADAPAWMAETMTQTNLQPKWSHGIGTWKAVDWEKPPDELQAAVEVAIENGIINGALATWGPPKDGGQYVGLPKLQKRFAAYEAIAMVRRHHQSQDARPFTVCGFVDPNGDLHVTGVFEGQLQAVDSGDVIEFDGQRLEPYCSWFWATDADRAARMAYDHP